MKRIICVSVILSLLLVCGFAETEYDFYALSGIGEMLGRLESGERIVCMYYADNAYEGFDRRFETNDPDDIAIMLEALGKLSIVEPVDIFVTDFYPVLTITLSDGSYYTVSFDGNYLEIDGQNYLVQNERAFFDAVDKICARREMYLNREEDLMLNPSIQGSMGEIYGELNLPAGEGKVPLVILSHGYGATHRGQSDYAEYFLSQGFATYNFDFCGGSPRSFSEGETTRMSVLTEAQDLCNIIDYFKNCGYVSDIILWGESQGGFVSTYVAAMRQDDVKALVAEYPAYVIQDDAKQKALPDGTFPETYFMLGMQIGRIYPTDALSFDIYEVMRNIECDTLILHGDNDSLVPIEYSRRALEYIENAELIVMPGQPHGFGGKSREEAMRLEAEFLLKHVS